MFRRVAPLGLGLLALAQNPPTFRTGTRLVQVDVVVRAHNGPIEGLTKDDFTLLDEGKPQQIALFSVTDTRVAQPHSAPLPPGAVSNRLNREGMPLTSGTILLIDRANTPVTAQPYANRKVLHFLEQRGAKDRMGIYVLGTSLQIVQELTDDPERLNRVARRLRTQDGRRISADDLKADPTGDALTDQKIQESLEKLEDFSRADRIMGTRDAMKAIARHLAKVPGRKNLIWVSAAFPLLVIRPHEIINNSAQVEEAARALNDANVAVYPVDARGLIGSPMGNAEQGGIQTVSSRLPPRPDPSGGLEGADTMNTLAALTGGKAFYNTNGIDESIQRAVEESELTYTLGFYPSEDSFDEKFHKLLVKVDRKGADVRFRKGYFANTLSGAQDTLTPLSKLLADPLDATEVGLQVDTSPDPAAPGSFHVRALVDPHDIHLERQNDRWQGTLTLSVLVEGAKTARNITRKIDIPEPGLAASLEKQIEVNDTVHIDGESAILRVVVQDQITGAAGSIRVRLASKQ